MKTAFSIIVGILWLPALFFIAIFALNYFGYTNLAFFAPKYYELRDNPKLATIAYLVDFNGKLHKICNSLGYGIPYATQFTNPQRDTYYGSGGSTGTSVHFATPQPEPNGLFWLWRRDMPSSADGTWVMCLDPSGKEVQPVYVEPKVLVSPFPLQTD